MNRYIHARRELTGKVVHNPTHPAHVGGQHRAPVGVSTTHGETDEERIERLRRSYVAMGMAFDEARVRAMYAKRDVEEFNRELERLAGQREQQPW
jgi:hypothetical protein